MRPPLSRKPLGGLATEPAIPLGGHMGFLEGLAMLFFAVIALAARRKTGEGVHTAWN
jgi:hypothetical protein